ncbi:MAG: glycosyltransferase [Loktanella sp.]|nr:glycosyltransferase [Loktanella sp.]
MIRAHLATFPARAGILMQTVQSILPQVDKLCICLNQYEDVPTPLAQEPKIETLIPDRDLKDAGKFAFEAAADDFVFTIDDDILYPPDYVKTTLQYFDRLGPAETCPGLYGPRLAERRRNRGDWMEKLDVWQKDPLSVQG